MNPCLLVYNNVSYPHINTLALIIKKLVIFGINQFGVDISKKVKSVQIAEADVPILVVFFNSELALLLNDSARSIYCT